MTAVRSTSAEDIGQALTELVRAESVVREVYVRQCPDAVELWLVTTPIDTEQELQLYELGTLLDQDFAGIPIDFSVINPALYDPFELEDLIPVSDPGVTLIYHA